MKTIEEIRKDNLLLLITKHGGIAALCRLLDMSESSIGRIVNGNLRHDRGGKPYQMGSPTARTIEEKLDLEAGWLDNLQNQASESAATQFDGINQSVEEAVKVIAEHLDALGPQQHASALDQITLLARSPDSERARSALVKTLTSGDFSHGALRFQA